MKHLHKKLFYKKSFSCIASVNELVLYTVAKLMTVKLVTPQVIDIDNLYKGF